jgi:hypothetical protein
MNKKPISKNEIEPKKWERIYEDEDTISIWKYNSKISMVNPYEVEIKYKKPPVTIGVKRTKLSES